MKPISSIVLMCLALLLCLNAIGQRTELKPSIKGDFKLPVVTSTPAFRDIMDGVIDIDLAGTFPFKSGFMLGIGGKFTYFEINDLALTPVVTDGTNFGINIYGKAGYEKLTGQSTFTELSLNFGYSTYSYSTRQCTDNPTTSGLFIEPRAGLYLFSSEQLAFGLIVSYQFVFQDFSHEQLCIDNLPRHQESEADGTIGIFTVGLGFSAGLARSASAFR